jgi:hypothetical protein
MAHHKKASLAVPPCLEGTYRSDAGEHPLYTWVFAAKIPDEFIQGLDVLHIPYIPWISGAIAGKGISDILVP